MTTSHRRKEPYHEPGRTRPTAKQLRAELVQTDEKIRGMTEELKALRARRLQMMAQLTDSRRAALSARGDESRAEG